MAQLAQTELDADPDGVQAALEHALALLDNDPGAPERLVDSLRGRVFFGAPAVLRQRNTVPKPPVEIRADAHEIMAAEGSKKIRGLKVEDSARP